MKAFIDSNFRLMDVNSDGIIGIEEFRYNAIQRLATDEIKIVDDAFNSLLNVSENWKTFKTSTHVKRLRNLIKMRKVKFVLLPQIIHKISNEYEEIRELTHMRANYFTSWTFLPLDFNLYTFTSSSQLFFLKAHLKHVKSSSSIVRNLRQGIETFLLKF